ncbi:MAG: Ig-like domain repeat protein [Salinibacterium sp.]|nr:Ig-like domain-containing protein [Salinibacterium sp.]MBF0672576.1 Ig-like domain repeat protein [Salinibacterium sp.]
MTDSRAPERAPRLRFIPAAVATLLAMAGVVAGPAPAASAAPVTDFASLQAALNMGGTVELGADISGGKLFVPVDVVLELSGHALTVTTSGLWDAAVFVQAGATFTVGTSSGVLHARGANSAAGIGGDLQSDAGNIVINGGTVIAETSYGTGIGAGQEGTVGSIEINGGHVTAIGGVGIGAYWEASAGDITINGGTVVAHGEYSAGIGSGTFSSVDDITITGGHVTSTGLDGPGIGVGSGGAGGDILITGGTIDAAGQRAGAIGGGTGYDTTPMQLGSITISGGTVSAIVDFNGPGIGVFNERMGGVITISGGTVYAQGGRESPGIGASHTTSPDIIISGGTVTAVGGPRDPGPAPIDRGGPAIGMGASVRLPGPIGAVEIGAAATVTVESGFPTVTSAIGASVPSLGFPAVTNAGTLVVASGSTLMIPTGTPVTNPGIIRGAVSGPVTVNSYQLTFAQPGIRGAASSVIPVYAPTLADAGIALPVVTRPSVSFLGWNSLADGSGVTLTPSTPLSTATWSALWSDAPTTTTASLSTAVVAAGGSVTLRASISPAVNGTIMFRDADGPLAGGVVTDGEFSLTVVAPPVGTHTITAEFEPDDPLLYRASSSAPMTLVVTPPVPVTPPAPSGPAVPAAPSAPASALPVTGTDAFPVALLAGALLLAGSALVVRRHRRRTP